MVVLRMINDTVFFLVFVRCVNYSGYHYWTYKRGYQSDKWTCLNSSCLFLPNTRTGHICVDGYANETNSVSFPSTCQYFHRSPFTETNSRPYITDLPCGNQTLPKRSTTRSRSATWVMYVKAFSFACST